MRFVLLVVWFICLFTSCDRIKEKTKSTISKGGEKVGEGASEFIGGISEGVDKSLGCKVVLSKTLLSKGVQTGVFRIENSSETSNNNTLSLYLIFDKDFDDKLFAKAFNKKGLEIGRVSLVIKSQKGEAGYYDFVFDPKTDIAAKSSIVIE